MRNQHIINVNPESLFAFSALQEGVPAPYHLRFNNAYQLAAAIARIPYQLALQMNNVEAIVEYLIAHPEGFNLAIARLTTNITINRLINNPTSLLGIDILEAINNELIHYRILHPEIAILATMPTPLEGNEKNSSGLIKIKIMTLDESGFPTNTFSFDHNNDKHDDSSLL